MRHFEGIADAADAIRRFVYSTPADQIPAHVRDRLNGIVATGTSPVDMGATFTEAVYANRAAFPAAALEIAAGVADQFDQQGYHARLDGRAPAMVLALRRDSGEKAVTNHPWPKAADDPAPKSDFAPPPATEEETA